MNTSVDVRTVINDAKRRATSCKTAQELSDIIQEFVHLVKMDSTSDSLQKEPISSHVSSCGIRYSVEFKREYISRHYSHFCEHILTHVDPSFLKDNNFTATLTRLFVEGPAELSFLALVSSISSVTHTDKLCLIVSILDNFASSGKFTELFLSQCMVNSSSHLTQELLTVLTSLPDKLANKMKLSLNGKFHPNIYYKMLGEEIIKTLIKVHEIASQTRSYTTKFLSNVIGKVALRGSTSTLLDAILPQLKEWCYTSPLWSNICSTVLMQVQDSALEPIIEGLLKKVTFYPFFCKILKGCVLTNTVVKHLMTHKFLLVRYYKEPNILHNIIGYLSGHGRRDTLIDVLKTMLNHWGNANTIKHTSYEQHFYITQAVILATVQLNAPEITACKNNLLPKLLSGVQAHLENPNNKIRQLGMVTAECMTVCLHPDSGKLKFEIEDGDDVKKLRALAELPKFSPDVEKGNFLNQANIVLNNDSDKKSPTLDAKDINGTHESETSFIDDDDDDLQPFEMSEGDNDLIEGICPPRYISQCVDGLLSADDPKRHIASLRVLKNVVKSDSDNLGHQCVQLVTILLHLQDKYSLEDYNELRFSAMVEVTVRCPIMVSHYLTKEFYAENYSLRQRMDILDVLAAAAAQLSEPDTSKEVCANPVTVNISEMGEAKKWKTVVQERIDKKTRRFSKKLSVVAPKATLNRFTNVAGHFFFPLLQGFDNRQNTFDLLGEDCMVLGLLVCTLGNVIYCARGTLIVQNMAKSLLEFVWVLRYHNDAHIRKGLLFSLAMVVISVPGFFLMTEVQNELAECQSWAENVLHNDPSAQCRELALQVLVSIRDVFQKQFNTSD